MKNVLCAAFLFASIALGQSITVTPIITDADIINASVLVDPLAEKVKNISPSNFSLVITNNNPANILKVKMYFEAYVTLEEDRKREQIAFGETTRPFLVSGPQRIFTSNDANNSSSDVDFKQTTNDPVKDKLKDKVLDGGGKVPSGVYEIYIRVTVDSVNGVKVNEVPVEINRSVNVTNPTTAILDVPFRNGYVYPTPFPQFQWTYDTRSVMLSVYEKRPEHQSLEDAISASDPHLQVRINRKASGNLTTFTYPQTASGRIGVEFLRGPRQLERGKMYVVVLDGIMTAFGYEVAPLRTIRSFVIADPQGQVILNVLQNSFSSGEFQSIMSALQDQNLQINTNGIELNGVRISPQELQRLLTENKDRIISVRFED